jgi:precorrin-2 dehydrogenase/sirohydrochlorin ferrochelatase
VISRLIVDLNLSGKTVLLVGGGKEAELKVRNLVDECGKLIIVSRSISQALTRLSKRKKARLHKVDVSATRPDLVRRFKPDIIMAVTDDPALNALLVKEAKKIGILSYSVDDPSISDFSMPAIARRGDLRIAFYTGGKSPLVSSILRKRVERLITKRDLEQIKLQEYARGIAKKRIADGRTRRRVLYSLVRSKRIKELLDSGMIGEEERKLRD